MTDLLPPNATPEERALSMATARMGLPDTALGIDTLWSPRHCPEELLPWLAWAQAVDVWDADWPVETKRRVIEVSISIRRRAGTVWAVREAIKAAGYADARLTEGLGILRHDGNQLRDGTETYAAGNRWAEFELKVDLGETEGITAASTATLLRLLYTTKPAGRHLRAVNHTATIEDVASADETDSAHINMPVEDDAHFGACHNGAILRNQAIILDPASVLRNGQWQHNGEQYRTGLSVYRQVIPTGVKYDNERDVFAFGTVTADFEQRWEQLPLMRDGRATRAGERVRDMETGIRLTDVCAGVLKWLACHNGRFSRKGAFIRSGALTESLTM